MDLKSGYVQWKSFKLLECRIEILLKAESFHYEDQLTYSDKTGGSQGKFDQVTLIVEILLMVFNFHLLHLQRAL